MADITPEVKTVNRADLLILLEDGPHGASQLATWLKQPAARVLWTLKHMAREGLVRRVGHDQRWALASMPAAVIAEPTGTVDELDVALADEEATTDDSAPDSEEIDALSAPPVRRPGRPKLRQDVPVSDQSREPGWWVKHAAPTDTARAGFIAESRHQFETRLQLQKTSSKLMFS